MYCTTYECVTDPVTTNARAPCHSVFSFVFGYGFFGYEYETTTP